MNSFKITVGPDEYEIELEQNSEGSFWSYTIRYTGGRYIQGRYHSREAALLELFCKIECWQIIKKLDT